MKNKIINKIAIIAVVVFSFMMSGNAFAHFSGGNNNFPVTMIATKVASNNVYENTEIDVRITVVNKYTGAAITLHFTDHVEYLNYSL